MMFMLLVWKFVVLVCGLVLNIVICVELCRQYCYLLVFGCQCSLCIDLGLMVMRVVVMVFEYLQLVELVIWIDLLEFLQSGFDCDRWKMIGFMFYFILVVVWLILSVGGLLLGKIQRLCSGMLENIFWVMLKFFVRILGGVCVNQLVSSSVFDLDWLLLLKVRMNFVLLGLSFCRECGVLVGKNYRLFFFMFLIVGSLE